MSPVASRTAEDLLRFRQAGKTAELVRGMLIVREPPGTGHGARAARLTVRAPDVAFVARQRLAHIPDEGYAELAPDWVAEIVSPNDRPGEVLEKVGQWLGAGVRVVWVLDQKRGDARIYRADGTVSTVEPDGELNGEDVLPGFRCPLRDIR